MHPKALEALEMNIPEVRHAFVDVDGVRVFYRETGPADALPVLLLHGFPSGSHQYRRLMDALGEALDHVGQPVEGVREAGGPTWSRASPSGSG
jgi:hypothetical protein